MSAKPTAEPLPEEVLALWAPQLPILAEEIIASIAAEVPAYARPLEGDFGRTVRVGVEEALRRFSDHDPTSARAASRSVYVAIGRGEAREGRSMEALLAAYRVGVLVAWRRLGQTAVAAGLSGAALVGLAESLFAYIDQLSAESAEGFAQEQAVRAGEVDRRRSELIELLVRSPAPASDALAAAAAAANWRVPPEVAILVWPLEAGSRPASRLPAGCIAAQLDEHWCAVIPDPAAPGRRGELDRAFAATTAGLGSVTAPSDAGRSHRRAADALELARARALEQLLAADEERLELLLRADPALLEDLAAARLAPLRDETPASRERLAATLLAWLRHQANTTLAAQDLGVHPQTVRYRVARLRELFGAELDIPDARYELETVLRSAAIPAAKA